ncbi:hypothetical protein [Flavobacterium sp. N3904]|uniref:hypothetical protein n=1 Tax=Flavobacterium sp. N3904 TaxID=2986835 RepID=UPI002224D8CB|nr:hypothetical protein [Flavobacterium sp. N3904]
MTATSGSKSTNTAKTKSTVSETGHAKNVANLQDVIAFVTGYGPSYNPSKKALKLPQLTALAMASQASLADVITKNTAYNNTVNDRAAAFRTLKPLATKVVNALQITDAITQKVDDAKGFNKKLQGPKEKKNKKPTDPNTVVPKTISTSQQSYDQQIQHFAALLSVVQSETSYAPNETELKMASLTAKQTDLIVKNNAVATAYAAVSNSRIARDTLLYKEETGLLYIVDDIKKYIKSIYGAASPEFAQVKGLKFRKKLA